MEFTIELHSVNGAVYSAGHGESRSFNSRGKARQYLEETLKSASSYPQGFVRRGDQRIIRGVRGPRGGAHTWSLTRSASRDRESRRLEAVAAYGPHAALLGTRYPDDNGLCLVCGDIPANSVHDGHGTVTGS